METSDGTLLGGRVRYAQPLHSYRTGIEPVLLAASVPAQAGQTVIEAGTGAGAGLMCLAARVPGITGVGVEIDPAVAALARLNMAANAMAELCVVTGNLLETELPPADHAMANPPWHHRGSTPSPNPGRRLAKQEDDGVEAWVAALCRPLRDGGSLTLVLPPGLVERAMTACLAAGLGRAVRHELHPRPGRAAKLVLIQAWRGRDGATRSGGTVLHGEAGFTSSIEAVLRHGAALAL